MDAKKKAITIKDIAKLARVSIGTVDRAIHKRGRVADSVAKRINKIIKEVGYKPNIFASRLSRSKVFSFSVVMPKTTQDDKYWESSVEGIKKAEEELAHYHVKLKYYFYDRYSRDELLATGEKIAASGTDGVLMAPVLSDEAAELVAKLSPGIPYVLFNTFVPGLAPVTFIGQDSYRSGLVCGKLMKLVVHSPGALAVVLTHPNDIHIRSRADGFLSFFASDSYFRVKEHGIYDFMDANDSSGGQPAIRRIFSESPDLKGIFVTNVSTYYFAEYLKNNPPRDKVFLIGYDLIDRNLAYMEDGIIDFLISQKPERQGYEGIYALYRKVVMGEDVSDRIMMPIDIITKENYGYYVNGAVNHHASH